MAFVREELVAIAFDKAWYSYANDLTEDEIWDITCSLSVDELVAYVCGD